MTDAGVDEFLRTLEAQIRRAAPTVQAIAIALIEDNGTTVKASSLVVSDKRDNQGAWNVAIMIDNIMHDLQDMCRSLPDQQDLARDIADLRRQLNVGDPVTLQ